MFHKICKSNLIFFETFKGLRCHLDDACQIEPCHGCDTSPVDGRRVCDCPPGKTGINCDTDVSECQESKNICFPSPFLKIH